MTAYYNEFDPFAAAWLRELIAADLIAPGDVDERSIEDVQADDLRGYCQCHFFAGIGGWSLALRLAGWDDDRPVWTGSCPCQPLSCAGQRKGHADERHLWPAFYRLIAERRPTTVFGEQVASPDGREWLAGIRADLEASRYAVGAADLCAASVGAPHPRHRLYWVADAKGQRRDGRQGSAGPTRRDGVEIRCETGGMADADKGERRRFASGAGCVGDRATTGRIEGDGVVECGRQTGGMGHTDSAGSQPGRLAAPIDGHGRSAFADGGACRMGDAEASGWKEELPDAGRRDAGSGPQGREQRFGNDGATGLWSDFDVIPFADEKWRRVEAGTFPLADAGSIRHRVGKLRGSGNAIVPQVAAEFIQAFEGVE